MRSRRSSAASARNRPGKLKSKTTRQPKEHWHVFSAVNQEVAELGVGEVGELVELPLDDYEVFTKVLTEAPAEAVVPDSECESGDEDYEAAPADDEELAPGAVGREVHDSMAFVNASQFLVKILRWSDWREWAQLYRHPLIHSALTSVKSVLDAGQHHLGFGRHVLRSRSCGTVCGTTT